MDCIYCGEELDSYDIGFYKKMVNRGAEEFMCIECTCGYFGMTVEKAHELIKQFQKQGCTLFPSCENE